MAKSRHRRKPKGRSLRWASTAKPLAKLGLAQELIEDGRLSEAHQLLEELQRLYPNRADVVQSLAYVCHALGNSASYLQHCIKLQQLTPDEEYNLLALASAYTMNARAALALRTYRQFLTRWPEHPEAAHVREIVDKLEAGLQEMIAEAGFVAAEGVAAAELHEEVQVALDGGRYEEGYALAQKLIERHPRFAPVYNNLSQMQFLNGQTEAALETARHVLSFAPDNFQATANLARMLFLLGRPAEAQPLAEKLKTLHSENRDIWVKKAETFSFLGDDQAVLDAFYEAEKTDLLEEHFEPAIIYHLAAAAEARLGQEARAREHWKKALELSPNLALAQENLDDLNSPVGERHGPWAYSLAYWLPRARLDEMLAQIKPDRKGEAALVQSVQKYLSDHPDITQLIPLLLERSDPRAAEFALHLAETAQTPELLAAVKNFATGQRGSDSLRMRAANIAIKHDLLSAGLVKMWIRGAWNEVMLINTEISVEPEEWGIPAKAKRLAEKAHHRLLDGDYEYAERLLQEALRLAPNDPRILNNLGQAYKAQGRDNEHRRLMQQIREQNPDYSFGIINEARECLARNEVDKAIELLAPLWQKKKMHISEMAILCTAQIEVHLKRGDYDAARSCFNLLEQVYPDHPNVEILRARLQKLDVTQMLRQFGWQP